MPWHVGNSPNELYALGCILGIKRIGIFDDKVCIEQFFPAFIRIGCERLGVSEVNHLLVARDTSPDIRSQASLCNKRVQQECFG